MKILLETDSLHALFMSDADNFKNINDTLGHQAGDKFLIAMVSEIKNCFRECDIVGRVGGDEFFVLMRNISEASEIEKKAQELLTAIQKICLDYASVHVSCSIGIGLCPEHGRTLEEIYAQADAALYQAKREGKNQFIIASR